MTYQASHALAGQLGIEPGGRSVATISGHPHPEAFAGILQQILGGS